MPWQSASGQARRPYWEGNKLPYLTSTEKIIFDCPDRDSRDEIVVVVVVVVVVVQVQVQVNYVQPIMAVRSTK